MSEVKAALVRKIERDLKTLRRPGEFTILLIAILCFLLIPPFFIDDALTGMLASIFLSILLLSVLYVFPRRQFAIAIVLAIPSLGGRWFLTLHQSTGVLMAVALFWAVFLAFTTVVILMQVLGSSRVSNDTISGAVCGYLLLGVMFAFLYAAIALAYPGSFIIDGVKITPELTRFFYQHSIGKLIYFSFVTLATLGYGDITPLSPPARSLAMLESVMGQFYVAILIARLVSIRYSRWGDEYD
ncbi:MAG: ion channel [Candidatus Binataceae bacterium]